MTESVNTGSTYSVEIDERRQLIMPFDRERRIDERLGIVETNIIHFRESLDDNKNSLGDLIERFDLHVIEEISTTQSLQVALVRITSTVDNLATELSRTNISLEKMVEKIIPTIKTVTRWSTVYDTIKNIIVVCAVVISASWAVYTFVIDHKDNLSITKTK